MWKIGTDLTDQDLQDLAARAIDSASAKAAGLVHVDHLTGKELVAASGPGDYEGMGIPVYQPGNGDHPVSWWLRRRNPEIDARTGRPLRKYLTHPGERNRLYYPRGVTLDMLNDPNITYVWMEGQLKVIAFWYLANLGTARPRFIPIGLPGVNGFRGTVGKTMNQNGERVAVKDVLPEFDKLPIGGRNHVIGYDADAVSKVQVRQARWAFSVVLRQRGGNTGNLEWPLVEGKGPDDWLANVGAQTVLEAIGRIEFNTATGWKSQLLTTDIGKPKPLLENVRIALSGAPEFAGLALDEFSLRVSRPIGLPWPAGAAKQWGDIDSIELATWMQRNHIECGKETADDAVQLVATRNKFHPVREYLEGLEWDGEARVDSWLTRYAGVAPSNYTSAAGRCWLISAVARVMRPGCKADVALLLVGKQRAGKSTMFRILAGDWFSDNLPSISNLKDAQVHLPGHWLIELAELEALSKSEMTGVKAFLSRCDDVYRPPWGRRTIHQPRQCVFAGTVNDAEPLKDATGGERWWPVDIGAIDLEALARDRDQLWAEAVSLFKDGAVWYFRDEAILVEARAEQLNKLDTHVWFERIERYCTTRDQVTVSQILEECIHKEPQHQGQADKLGVVRCLQALGWKRSWAYLQGVKSRVYLSPGWLFEQRVGKL